jgi:hypothetical protein
MLLRDLNRSITSVTKDDYNLFDFTSLLAYLALTLKAYRYFSYKHPKNPLQ